MEHNTIVIDAVTGEIKTEYQEQIEDNTSIVIDYEERVIELIRQKYSVNQELAILRQQNEKIEEFQEYFDYCEQCKLQAKQDAGITG